MARARIALRILLSAALFASTAVGDAPTGLDPQYVTFDRDDPTIKDRKTQLEWERFFTRTLKSYGAATQQCTDFRATSGHVPTIKELMTIFDEEPHLIYEGDKNVTKYIDRNAFSTYTGVDKPYWSSTPVGLPSGNLVWGFSFADGSMVQLDKSNNATTAYVRCVR